MAMICMCRPMASGMSAAMLSTVVKRFCVAAFAAAAIGSSGPVMAAHVNNEASVVAKLYKDFAWQAFATQEDLFGTDVTHQPRTVLDRYFAPPLADLLIKDAACQVKYRGICHLESDLLFDSQDPRVIDLEVSVVAPGKVAVVFADPATGEKTRIDFDVSRIAGRWKITDIIYRQPETMSLKRLLSHKIP